MSNQQPRQFTPSFRNSYNPNSNQRPNFNNTNGKNFVSRQNKEGFNPEPIQEQRHKPRPNNNFHYNYNNSNSTNTNSNTSNNSSTNTNDSNVSQTNSQNSNVIDNNQNNVDNNSPISNESIDEKEQPPPIQCPLCNEKKFKYHSECVFHIIKTHNCQGMIQKNIVGNCQCKHCGKLLTNDDEFIAQHMYDYHREEFFASFTDGPVRKNDRYKKLKNYFRKVLTIKEEPRIIRKVIQSQYNIDEEEDEDQVNFIASSIHLNGLSSHDEVKIQNVKPIENPISQSKTEIIDHNFWVKLNNITERLSNSGQIQTNENHYYCYICKKGFDSHVRLLSHCWNKHQNH